MILKRLFELKRKLRSNKDTPEPLEISRAVSRGVRKAVEQAIHGTVGTDVIDELNRETKEKGSSPLLL